MANIDQVISQIRFQLEQLSTKNAYHDFEHLCRHLARARICSNIIPATGPVSAGGDQGRDFETFRTYLSSSPIANSAFIGLVSQKPIAFACSLRKVIIGKIKTDANTIMASGAKVEVIYYFCTSDIPVARRHELQSWAKEKYSIELEIHDGQSISELLADQEVFWIAEKYLGIPSEIFPRVEDKADWYSQSLKFWKEKNKPTFSYADFYEIKAAIRHATFTSEVKQDLPFWIGLMETFISPDSPEPLKRRVIYEITVASLRGLGTLIGQEERLREYFDIISKLEDPVDLEDASALLNYCIGASYRNIVQLTDDELSTWRNKLLSRVEERLKAANTPGLKCPLLDIRGYLSLSIDPRQPSPLDVEDAIKWWTELTLVAKDAPLFPLERFADHLTNFIGFIGENPKYDYLTQQVDLLLSDRHGDFIAAEKCRDRAIEFYKKGKILRAINQLHQAKVKWFAEETLRGSLLSMLLISKWYLELGLSFAAKYYALAVAFITLHSPKSDVKSLLSRALISAAECDYHQGSWCGFLELTDIGLRAHGLFSKDAGDLATHDELQRTLFHTTTLMTITKRLDLQLFEFIAGVVQKWNIEDVLKEFLPIAHDTWRKQSISELWRSIEEQLGGRPFGDLGTVREVTWSELGITWKINWKNDYNTTPAAEQLIAILQILLADLAGADLCLLKTDVNINVCVENIIDAKVESMPSNVGRKWKVTLPICSKHDERSKFERLQVNVLAVAYSILAEVSLLPSERFYEVLENCFRNGISMKVFVAKPYEILYREFISKEVFESSNRSTKSIPESHRQFKIKEHEELAWFGDSGSGYSEEIAEEYLKNRYARSTIPIEYTLKRLLKNPEFKSTVERLRADGWLDWHILTSVFAAAINYRVRQNSEARHDIQVYNRLFQKIMNEPERKTSTLVPLSEFTEKKLRMCQRMNMLSTLKVLGLECRQSTPDFEAIDHFLRVRYNYWTDDIEHTDPFLYHKI